MSAEYEVETPRHPQGRILPHLPEYFDRIAPDPGILEKRDKENMSESAGPVPDPAASSNEIYQAW